MAVKWRLWHGRVDRAIRDLERLLATLKHAQRDDKFSIARLHSLRLRLLTYVRSNRGAIVNYGKRYRAELRDRLRTPFRQPEPNVPSLFKPKPPLLRAA